MQASEDRVQTAPSIRRDMAITTIAEPEDHRQPARSTVHAMAYVYSALSVFVRLLPILSVFGRRLPCISNLAPVGALCLFAGSRARGWRAYLLPMAVMVVSDLILFRVKGDSPFDPFVYASYLLNILFGAYLLRKISPVRVVVGATFSSLQFFLLTNFGCWLYMTDAYSRSLSGLITCYAMAVPFYGPTMASDFAFSALFFGVYAFAASRRTAVAKEPA
jgi:hypothetical protein